MLGLLVLGSGCLGAGVAAELRLAWNHDGKNISGFVIERASTGGSFAEIDTTGPDARVYTDSGLADGTAYRYQVRAFNGFGKSAPSNVAAATTPAAPSDSGTPASSDGPLSGSDIGSPYLSGSTSFGSSSGAYTLQAGGSDIWGASDQFHFAYQPVTGDATLVVRVDSLTQTDGWAKAGLMLRSSSNADSAHVSVFVTPANGVRMQWRPSTSGESSSSGASGESAPRWLKLTRSGNTFTAFSSPNGSTWTQVHTLTLSIPSSVLGGLAVTAHNPGSTTTAQFSNFTVSYSNGSGSSGSDASSGGSGSGGGSFTTALVQLDIGSPTLTGSTLFDPGTGSYYVQAGGIDIWGTSDQFHFAHAPTMGTFELKVRVAGVTPTNPWTKVGLMIRDSLAADSRHASLFMTPDFGVVMQGRTSKGAESYSSAPGEKILHQWLRLRRTGDHFTAFRSADGANWTFVADVDYPMDNEVFVGLAVTSHDAGSETWAVLESFSIRNLQNP